QNRLPEVGVELICGMREAFRRGLLEIHNSAQGFTKGAWVLSGEVAYISYKTAVAHPVHSNAIRHGHDSPLVLGRDAVGCALFSAAQFFVARLETARPLRGIARPTGCASAGKWVTHVSTPPIGHYMLAVT